MTKKFRKLLFSTSAIAAVIAPVAAVVSCGDDSSVVSWDPAKKDSAVLVGGVTGHDDKGFLQGTYDGLQEVIKSPNSKLKVYGEIKAASSADAEYQKAATSALINGAYSVWGAGYQYGSFNKAEFAGKYTDRKFIALDATIDGTIKPNVTAFDFEGGSASFAAGVATGFYMTKHAADFGGLNDLKVATFGGQAFAPVVQMMQGFQNGVKYFNDNFAKTGNEIQFVYPTSKKKADLFVGGFQPDAAGKTKADTLFTNGADVIFPVAGGQVAQVVKSIKEKTDGKKRAIVGVDVDQRKVFGAAGDGQYFIGSSLKNMKKVTHDIADTLFNGVAHTGVTLGAQNHGKLAQGYVGITQDAGFGESVTVADFQNLPSGFTATTPIADLFNNNTNGTALFANILAAAKQYLGNTAPTGSENKVDVLMDMSADTPTPLA